MDFRNSVYLEGFVGNEPEVKTFDNGNSVATLSICTKTFPKINGEIKEKIEWHRCVCWGDEANKVKRYVKKGTHIWVEGRLETKKWTDKDGIDRYITEIIVENSVIRN